MHKKILLVTRPLCEPWDEASKNFAYDLAKQFSACDDLELHIMTNGHLADVPAQIIQHPVYSQSAFGFFQKVRSLFFQLKNRKKFDIIHYMFTPAALNSFIIKNFISNPSHKSIQTLATLREDLYTPEELKKVLFGDVIVTYSLYAKEKLLSLMPDRARHIEQIYPGIDLIKYKPAQKDPDLLEKWKIKKSDTIVSYAGEYVRLGATDLIIDAFLELWKKNSNHHIKYLCACRIKDDKDAAKKKDVMARFEKAGHTDKVIYTDTYADMNKIYNLSDIVLFPALNMRGKFDVPLAMVEPYACKKPVVTSDLPLFSEFSSSAFNVIIPRGDHQALATVLNELAMDHERRADLGEHAYDFAHKTFNITEIALHYEKLYRQL